MKKTTLPLIVISVLLTTCATSLIHAQPVLEPEPSHLKPRLIAKPIAKTASARGRSLNKATEAEKLASTMSNSGVTVMSTYPNLAGLQVLEVQDGQSSEAAQEELMASGQFEYVEEDKPLYVNAVPNDPLYKYLWAMNNTGQEIYVNNPSHGTPGVDIGAQAAWDIRNDASNIIVAVIDTGIKYDHPDLAANMWRNPGEQGDDSLGRPKASNGVDDDANGVVDDVFGYNSINGSGNPMDDHNHGTHCAGTIGGVGNNGVGVTGVAWKVQLMAVKFLSAGGWGWTSDAVKCVDYARRMGAHIMSNSWGGGGESQALGDAIRAARDEGIIFVCAAGNANKNTAKYAHFPSAYTIGNVVAVGSHDYNGVRSYFSNYGVDTVAIFAPGSDIWSSITKAGQYDAYNGTSMATPHVSGALALIKAQFPTESWQQNLYRLYSSGNGGFSSQASSGVRLNLHRALTITPPVGGFRPRNDNFSARLRIPSNATNRMLAHGATSEVNERNHASVAPGGSVWFSWLADVNGEVKVNTEGSEHDTTLAVYTGDTMPNLVPVVENDDRDAQTTSSYLTFNAVAGTVYSFAIGSKSPLNGLAILRIEASPDNDDFANAQIIESEGTATLDITSSNSGATLEVGEPTPVLDDAVFTRSVWFRYTAETDGLLDLRGLTANEFEPIISIFSGTSLTGLTLLSESYVRDLGGGGGKYSRQTLRVNQGQTYYIRVGSYDFDNGIIRFSLGVFLNPENDLFSGSENLTERAGRVSTDNSGATRETGEPLHGGLPGVASMWYQWTAPDAAPMNFNSSGSSFDTVLSIYTGDSVDALTQVASNDDSSGRVTSSLVFTPVAGTTYRIAVSGKTVTAFGKFNLGYQPSSAPANNTFSSAVNLSSTGGTVESWTYSASSQTGEPNHYAGGTSGATVWFNFTPAYSSVVTLDTIGSNFDTVLGVYTGSAVTALTLVTVNDDVLDRRDKVSEVTFSASKGTTYRIVVAGKTTGAQTTVGLISLNLGMTPGNGLPVVTNATLTPGSDAFAETRLAVGTQAATDPDDDIILGYSYLWQTSNDGVTFQDEPVLTEREIMPVAGSGKLWRCVLRAYDGIAHGPEFITASVAVDNRPVIVGRHGVPFSYDSNMILQPTRAIDRHVMINEYSNSRSSANPPPVNSPSEWVELIVLRDCDLRNHRFQALNFANLPVWQNVPAGTVIVIYDSQNFNSIRNPVLPADDTDISDRRLVLPSGSAAHFTGVWGNTGDTGAQTLSFFGPGGTTTIDAVGINGGPGSPSLGNVGLGRSFRFNGDFDDDIDASALWAITLDTTVAPSPGVGNSASNINFIVALRDGTWSNPPQFRLGTGTSLPPGISLNATTGLVSGTPNLTGGGLYPITIERFHASGMVSRFFKLLVGDQYGVFRVPLGQTWELNQDVVFENGTFLDGGGAVVSNGFSFSSRQSFASWRAAFLSVNPGALENGDEDGDGHSNFLEFLLGGNPSHGEAALMPHEVSTIGQDDFLTISFQRQKAPSSTNYLVEASDDLVQWEPLNLEQQMVGSPVSVNSLYERIKVRDHVPLSEASKRFLRVRAIHTSPAN